MAVKNANSLTTWKRFKDLYGAADSEQVTVENLIEMASARANREANRLLKARDHTEYHDGVGGHRLILRQNPINSVTGVYFDTERLWEADTLVDPSLYYIDPESEASLVFDGTSLPVKGRSVKVIYNAGYVAGQVPEDLEEAVLELVTYWYKEFGDKRVGLSFRTAEGRQSAYTHLIPKDIFNVFAAYRRHWVL